jgi:hypothetical protein
VRLRPRIAAFCLGFQFDDDETDVVAGSAEGHEVRHKRVINGTSVKVLDLTQRVFKPSREVGTLGIAMLDETVAEEEENVALAHDRPFVDLVWILEPKAAGHRAAVDGIHRRQHPDRREGEAPVWLDFHEPVVRIREDGGEGLGGREEPEPRVLGDLPIQQRQELVSTGRLSDRNL